MHRLIFVALFGLLLTAPAHAQQRGIEAQRQGALPAESLPTPVPDIPRTIGVPSAPLEDQGTLGEQEILRRLGRIYRLQSEILEAQANQDADAAEDLLSVAMAELATLINQPGMMERGRFRESYRSLIAEYERFYGVEPDSLGMQYGDIFHVKTEMFAAMNRLDHPLLEDVFLPEIRPLETQIEMTMNRLVEQSIAFLQRNPDRHISNWLSRAETYFPMIEQILAEEGAPDELKYLAMIESGLNPRAKSWASAVGMWQFMAPTGRSYGLHVNAWVDDRMNPEKATRAAARHMNDLYEMFGDWHLALAAYNAGPGNVRRAQRRSGKTTFWDIYDYLPRETRNYVPMFIATSLVASNPEAFNLREPEPGPRYAYHHVPVNGMFTIGEIARMAGTSEDAIRALNPELRQSVLPPSRSAYYVRIPYGTHERFIAEYEALPSDARRTATEHIVRRGDSLGRISSQHGISVSDLMQTNGLRSTVIHPGQRLVIPVPMYTSGEPATAVPTGQILAVEYGTRSRRPIMLADASVPAPSRATAPQRPSTPVVQASLSTSTRTASASGPAASAESPTVETREEESAPDTRVVYSVRRGDNLSSIAGRYGVSVSQIRGWNNLRSNTIRVGQRLTLYTGSDAPEAAPQPVTHVVARGETLSGLASRYGVSISAIRGWNNLRTNNIRVGQRLTIHSEGGGSITHRVERGDTLSRIANRYGVSITEIRAWNNLRGNTIRVGQSLTINT